jgi:sporulation protein YlmC with PRC-barrel domain
MATVRGARIPTLATAARLHSVKDLQDYAIGATDGDMGTVQDLYSDDESWTARYLVVDTGGWLAGRRVLIPPHAIQRIDAAGKRVITSLTKQQVKDSPGIDANRPVSRPYEMQLYGYYGYPYYWAGPYRWGPMPLGYGSAAPYPAPAAGEPRPSAAMEELAAREHEQADPHLRSVVDVRGHGIQATDGELGHVEDMLVEEDSLAIRYLIVDPINWWPGKHVLVATEWIKAVNWDESTVEVTISKDAIRNAPEFDPAVPIDRDYENRYLHHFGRSGYWERADEDWRLPSSDRAR